MRHKIIDSFNQASRMLNRNRQKQIYLKIDSDAHIVAEFVLQMIKLIHNGIYPTPVEFGNAYCGKWNIKQASSMCFTQEGMSWL